MHEEEKNEIINKIQKLEEEKKEINYQSLSEEFYIDKKLIETINLERKPLEIHSLIR